MTALDELLDANRRATLPGGDPGSFVANRHLCILTCVDPRLTRFFPAALGLERGNAVAVRLPGASVRPGSDALRGLAASIYVNDCQEVLVLCHTDCGAARVKPDELRRALRTRGVPEADVPSDVGDFFGLVADARQAALDSARAIRAAPFLPRELPVHVGEIDVRTGRVTLLERGYGLSGR